MFPSNLGSEAAQSSYLSGAAEGGHQAALRFEVHHRVPCCLLGYFDWAQEGDLDGTGLQIWFDWEEEAFRYGVDPDISRKELSSLIASSNAKIPATEHRRLHQEASDFVR